MDTLTQERIRFLCETILKDPSYTLLQAPASEFSKTTPARLASIPGLKEEVDRLVAALWDHGFAAKGYYLFYQRFGKVVFTGFDKFGFVMTDAFMEEMIKTFQQTEKRLWNQKIILPFVQWEGFFPPFGMDIKFTEVIMLNSVKGRVFSNLGLKKFFYRSIDRNVFLDYHALYTPYPVYEVHHLYQMSIYHDTNLPNN